MTRRYPGHFDPAEFDAHSCGNIVVLLREGRLVAVAVCISGADASGRGRGSDSLPISFVEGVRLGPRRPSSTKGHTKSDEGRSRSGIISPVGPAVGPSTGGET